ncbi:homoserine/homoserine lactone efflux protein [Arthrobacter sp. Hiyo8]|nr:homoserine/homoserine lactone efflux protein [Arthrobacter sp. Hiyo8]
MQISLWLALVGAGTLISFTPGAGAISTMSNSLNSGFRRSIWGVLGQQAALIMHILIVALGVGVLVSSSPVVFNVIRYTGRHISCTWASDNSCTGRTWTGKK